VNGSSPKHFYPFLKNNKRLCALCKDTNPKFGSDNTKEVDLSVHLGSAAAEHTETVTFAKEGCSYNALMRYPSSHYDKATDFITMVTNESSPQIFRIGNDRYAKSLLVAADAATINFKFIIDITKPYDGTFPKPTDANTHVEISFMSPMKQKTDTARTIVSASTTEGVLTIKLKYFDNICMDD